MDFMFFGAGRLPTFGLTMERQKHSTPSAFNWLLQKNVRTAADGTL